MAHEPRLEEAREEEPALSEETARRECGDPKEEEEEGPTPKGLEKAGAAEEAEEAKLLMEQEQADLELAQRLAREEVGRPARATRTSARRPAAASTASSTTTTSSSSSRTKGGSGGSSGKKAATAKRTNPFNAPCVLSAQLAGLLRCGPEERISRPQVIKRLWAVIKEQDLQDPKDKRFICCNGEMKALFGKARVSMFGMNKVLSKHIKHAGDLFGEEEEEDTEEDGGETETAPHARRVTAAKAMATSQHAKREPSSSGSPAANPRLRKVAGSTGKVSALSEEFVYSDEDE